ncbi:Hexaprenyldihydroxybenzoate methyltransferase, mitochondrial-like protein [Gossypium australe]|uniref:Hexaprenyldihydroxybenzoate methyltransferase, mitochondrial-like protein n=1 Tax=Gossypium australe TaxID=47621 RepID=A0A5B6X2I3_9ROSI|nr:Hexaprenyldihydroxybenzoate methyltransferase, mitochondrial-like protein [Gossypium australe]
MACSFNDYLRCDMSLLKDEAYNWWSMLTIVVPRDRLSKYAPEIASTEDEMCTHFEEGLKDEIKILVGATELREFMVLFDQAQKMEEIYKNKKQNERKSRGANHSGTKDTTVRSKARVPARAYAIQAREEATVPDMLLPFHEFDIILGMDWLTLHDAIVNYRLKFDTRKYRAYKLDT